MKHKTNPPSGASSPSKSSGTSGTSGGASGKTNRRDFLKYSAMAGMAGVGFWVAGRGGWAFGEESKSPNEKLNVACIGVGGKGESDTDQVAKHANLVAICDIDENSLNKMGEKHPDAKKFTDYRKLFDSMAKEIDGVTVSTPDHNHAPAAMLGIKHGKAVYCQKPMTHNVYEARALRMAAREHKVATQLGNQGTASAKLREGVEAIRAGVLGAVREVHVWTNRPIWPQAPYVELDVPIKTPPTPEHIHWDQWIGPAAYRPYGLFTYKDKNGNTRQASYHPFNWRGWWDFGTGALGDMGCHTANMPFMALNLEYPTSIVAECGDLNDQTYPSWATIHYEFPARYGLPPVKLTWWEGHKDYEWKVKNQPPTDLFQGQKINDSGSLIIGDKGTMYSPHDYGGSWMLLPKDEFADFKAPNPTLPRNPKGDDEGQKIEWIAAAKGGPAALSNFDYSGLLTEFLLLGNVAIRESGNKDKLQWDGANLKFTNRPEANKYLKYEYRKGWEL